MLYIVPQSIVKTLDAMKIGQGMVVADFGAGSGFVSLELAKRVGDTGTVYAIDILPEPLEVLESKAHSAHYVNIKTIKGDLEKQNGSTLENDLCDWVVISNILFQASDQQAVVTEAMRILKPKAKVAVIEWHPEKMIARDAHQPLSPDQTKKLFEQAKFRLVSKFEPDAMHYGMIFQK